MPRAPVQQRRGSHRSTPDGDVIIREKRKKERRTERHTERQTDREKSGKLDADN